MKKLSFWSQFTFLLLSIFSCHYALAAMTADIPVENDRIKLGFSVAYAHENRTQITELASDESGNVNANSPNTYGFNNKNAYDSYSIGMFLWLPMVNWYGMDFNAALAIDHIPGANVSAGVRTQTLDDAVFIKSHRTNFSAGLNVIKPFGNDMFMAMTLAGGISRYSIRGEQLTFVNSTGNELRSVGGDHPGAHTTTPFVNVKIALGKQLTSKSHAMIFGDYTLSRRDTPLTLAAHGVDDMRVDVLIPKHWFQVGIAFIRELNL